MSLLDSDFVIEQGFNHKIKFVGKRSIKFSSNCHPSGNSLYTAYATVKDNCDVLHLVRVRFNSSDVINYGEYSLPVKENKKGERHGCRLKNKSFEVKIIDVIPFEHQRLNRYTGQNITWYTYDIIIEYNRNCGMTRISDLDDSYIYQKNNFNNPSNEVNTPIKSINTFENIHERIFVTSYVYYNNEQNRFLVNAILNDKQIQLNLSNFEIKVEQANPWQHYTIYNPIINGRGCNMKNRYFDIDLKEIEKFNIYKSIDGQIESKEYCVITIDPYTIKPIRRK